jgi:hypothetical protein
MLDWTTRSGEGSTPQKTEFVLILDQLLELHSNLTVVQARLLEVLQAEAQSAQERGGQQAIVQANWDSFTESLGESLGVLSANTSALTTELLGALIRLQAFTRDSAAGVAEQLGVLEGDIGRVRDQIWQVQLEMDVFGEGELSAVGKLGDASQERLFMVPVTPS